MMAGTEDSRPRLMPERTVVAGPGARRLGDVPHRGGLGRGVVLGDAAGHLAEHHAGEDRPEHLEVVDVELGDEEASR